MTTRSRYLALLLALTLVLVSVPALAQSDSEDSRTMGDIIADALEDLAREIGSAQDDISDLAEGIDPSDPDGAVDPSDPEDDIDPSGPSDPGDIDPSDPDSNPGEFDPDEPVAPGPDADAEPEAGDEIDLPAPAEPEEGGFAEIQLLPDPVPLAGGWKVVNHPGTMTCTGAGTIALKRSRQSTQLAVKQDGRVLKGPKLAPGAKENIELTWQPESEAYTGVVTVAAPGGKTRIRFYMRVVSPTKMKGEMVATVNVDAQGVSASCGGTRKITLTHK